jgi:hypothetical protein
MIKQRICALGCALVLAIGLLWHFSATAQAETLVYTDTVPVRPMRWADTMTFPRFDPTLGILTRVEITLTSGITGSTSYTNQVGVPTQVSIDIPATVRLELPNSTLLNAGGTIFSFTEIVGPFGSGARTFAGTVANNTSVSSQPDLAFYTGAGLITMPLTATSSFIAGGDVGNFDFQVRTSADAMGVVRYTYLIPQVVIKKFTNGFDADNPNDSDVPRLNPGDLITWTYLVTNTGPITIPLALISVSDSQTGVIPVRQPASDVGGDGLLAPGETWVYLATGAVAADLEAPPPGLTLVPGCNPGDAAAPGNRPTYRNIGTVFVPGSSATDPSHYCNPPRPGITMQKLTNGADANGPNDNDVPQILPGSQVTWTYLVTNTGNVTYRLAQVVVTDDQPGVTPLFDLTSDDGDGLLSPGERWRYTATGVAANLQNPLPAIRVVAGCNPSESLAPGFRNTYANIGTVVVPDAQASDPSHYCNPPAPGIVIRKLTNGFDANNPNDSDVPQLAPGSPVTWSYLVTNTGNVTFTRASVVVVDSQTGVTPLFVPSSDVGGDDLLAPGESWRYLATGTAANLDTPGLPITRVPGCNPGGGAAPGNRATYRNIGTVTVPGASDTDPSHYCNPPRPGITIKKYTNGADADDPDGNDVPLIRPGNPVLWTYLVTNTGNVTYTLAQVVVTDSQPGITPIFDPTSDDGDGLLSPAEGWRYTATGVADNLQTPPAAITVVAGCSLNDSPVPGARNAYANIGTVVVPNAQASDPSHYCNEAPTALPPDDAEPTVRFFLPVIWR